MTSAFKEEVHNGPSPPPSVHGARGISAKGEQPGTFLDGPGRDDISTDDHVQEKVAPGATLTKRQKFKRHCGRFKWWYVAGNIIFLAILLPLM